MPDELEASASSSSKVSESKAMMTSTEKDKGDVAPSGPSLTVNIPTFDRQQANLAPVSALPALHYSPQASPLLRASTAMPPPPLPSLSGDLGAAQREKRKTSDGSSSNVWQSRSASGSSASGSGTSATPSTRIRTVLEAAAAASGSGQERGKSSLAHAASIRGSRAGKMADTSARRMSTVATPQGIDEYARIIVQSRNAKMQKWKAAFQVPPNTAEQRAKPFDSNLAGSRSFSSSGMADAIRSNERKAVTPAATPNVSPTASPIDKDDSDEEPMQHTHDGSVRSEIEWVDWLDEYRQLKEAKLRAEVAKKKEQNAPKEEGDGRPRSRGSKVETHSPLRLSPSAAARASPISVNTNAYPDNRQNSPLLASKASSSTLEATPDRHQLPHRRPSELPLHVQRANASPAMRSAPSDTVRSWSDTVPVGGEERISHRSSVQRRPSTLLERNRNMSLSPVTSRSGGVSGSQSWSTGPHSSGKRKKILSGKIEAWWGAVKSGFGTNAPSPPLSAPMSISRTTSRKDSQLLHPSSYRGSNADGGSFKGGEEIHRVHSMFKDQTFGGTHTRSRTHHLPEDANAAAALLPLRTTSSTQDLKGKTTQQAEDIANEKSKRSSSGTVVAKQHAAALSSQQESSVDSTVDQMSVDEEAPVVEEEQKGLGIEAGKDDGSLMPHSIGSRMRKTPKLSLQLEHGLSSFDAGPFDKLTPQSSTDPDTASSVRSTSSARHPQTAQSPKTGLSDAWKPNVSTATSSGSSSHHPQHTEKRSVQSIPQPLGGLFAQPSQRRRSKLRDSIAGEATGGSMSSNERKDITVDSVRRHIHHRLAVSKESCDRELRKVIVAINSFVEERIEEEQMQLLLKRQQDDNSLDATTQALAAVNLGGADDDAGEMDHIHSHDTDKQIRSVSMSSTSSASTTRREQPEGSASAQAPAGASEHRANTDAWLNAQQRPRQSSLASRKEYMLPPPPLRTPSSMARSISRGGQRTRSREATSASTSRSHSPLPGAVIGNRSDSPQYSPVRRVRPLPPTESAPSEPYMDALQELVVIAMDVLDTSIHTLTARSGACREVINAVQEVGRAWETNPEWPGRGWYVKLLLAVAALSRVVEWWEAERGFWNFHEGGDENDQEPIRFIVGSVAQPNNVYSTTQGSATALDTIQSNEAGEALPPSVLPRSFGTSSPVRLIRSAVLSSSANKTPSQRSSATNSPALEAVDRRGTMEPIESGMRSTRSSTPPVAFVPPLDEATSGSESPHQLAAPPKSAVKDSQNILIELSLDGECFLYISPAWQTVLGTDPADLFDQPIEEVLAPGDAATFAEATQQLQLDDSHTVEAVFRILVDASMVQNAQPDVRYYQESEGKGMLMRDRQSGTPTHTMWVIKTVGPPEEEGQLGPVRPIANAADFSMAAGSGAVEEGDPQALLSTEPVLCRICERDIPACFFERHSEICNEIHRLEMEITDNNEVLSELRKTARAIVLQLESSTEQENPEYRNIPLTTPPASTFPPSALEVANRSLSPRNPNPASIRKAHLRLLNSVADILRTAATISTPATKDDTDPIEKQRLLSPESEGKIVQVRTWKSPPLTTEEPALELLVSDVEAALRRKLGAVNRMLNTIVYVETIRLEWEHSLEAAMAETQDEGDDDEDLENAVDTSSTVSMSDAELQQDDSVVEQSLPQPTSTVVATSTSEPSSLKEELRDSLDDDDMEAETSAVLLERYEPEIEPGSTTLSAKDDIGRDDDIPEVDTSMGGNSVLDPIPIPIPTRTHAAPRVRTIQQQRDASALSSSGGEGHLVQPESSLSVSAAMPHARRESALPAVERTYLQTPPLSPRHSPMDAPSSRTKDRRVSHSLRAALAAPNSPLLGTSMPVSPRIPPMAPSSRTTASSIKDFDIIKPISKGAFGSVFLTRKRTTGDYFAIKVLKKSDMISKNQITNVKAERMILMTQTQSPFVVKLFFTFQSAENLYLVMEYLPGGDCATLIKNLGSLPEQWAKQYLAEVVNGLETLHAQGIVHRDMKPDNLLIDQHGHLKLTDFGLSKIGLLGRQNHQQMSAQGRGSIAVSAGSNSSPWQQSYHVKKDSFSSASPAANQNSALSTSFSPTHSRMPPINMPSTGFHSAAAPSYPRGRIMSASTDASDSSGSEGAMAFGSGQHRGSLSAALDSPRNAFGAHASTSGSGPQQLHGSGSGGGVMAAGNAGTREKGTGSKKFVGTPDYLAPESILGLDMDDAAVDWWALGVILYELLYGYPPFHSDTPEKVFDNILSRKINWDDDDVEYSDEARDLMERLMCTDRRSRLGANGANEIKSHPFFAGIDWSNLTNVEGPFVPQINDPESTDYFDLRGAVFQDFQEHTTGTKGLGVQEFAKAIEGNARMIEPSRPPTRNRIGSDRHAKEMSETQTDDFGSFSYKNLPVLKQANDEVIKKMRGDQLNSMSALIYEQQQPMSSSFSQQAALPQQFAALSISQGASAAAMTHMRHRSMSGKAIAPPASHRASMLSGTPGGPPSPTTSISSQSSVPSKSTAPTSPSGAPFMLSTGAHQLHHQLIGSHAAAAAHHHHRRRPSELSAVTSAFGANSPMGGGSISSASGVSGPLSSVTERKKSQFIQHEDDGRRSSLPNRLRTASLSSGPTERPALPWQIQVPHEAGVDSGYSKATLSATPSDTAGQLASSRSGADSAASVSASGSGHAHQMGGSGAGLGLMESDYSEGVTSAPASNRGSADTGVATASPMDQVSCLVAEDNPISLRMLEMILKKLGCQVTSVRNGAEALRLAMGEIKFSVIFLDVTLPIVSGQDVARMIRSTRNANCITPIIALTAFDKHGNIVSSVGDVIPSSHQTAETLIEASGGVYDAVLTKPCERVDVCNVLPKFGFHFVNLKANGATTTSTTAYLSPASAKLDLSPAGATKNDWPSLSPTSSHNAARRATIASASTMLPGSTIVAGSRMN